MEFVICKTGFGSDYPGQQDSGFAANVKLLDAAGIPWGAYHFSYATTRNGGIQEAKHMLRLLNGRKPLYGVWFDMEANSTLGGDLPARRRASVRQWRPRACMWACTPAPAGGKTI